MMDSMNLYLGIDGGGTRTRAVLVPDSGKVLGVGEAASSNFNNVGEQEAGANLHAATEAAFRAAGMVFRPVVGAFLGLAGVKSSEDIARMTSVAEACNLAPAGSIMVKNDLYNALAGGLDGEPGIALIAGTGSNCLGKDASGKDFMCGGWGWLMDDNGSGWGLSADALRVAVRMADGREIPTRLLPTVLSFYGVSEANALLARLYNNDWSPAEIAGFAPVVIRLASEGDEAAKAILHRGAGALSELIATTAAQLDFPDGPRVVLLGGCARSGPPYQTLVEEAVQAACPRARLQVPVRDTTYGAALNALSLAKKTAHPDFPNK